MTNQQNKDDLVKRILDHKRKNERREVNSKDVKQAEKLAEKSLKIAFDQK